MASTETPNENKPKEIGEPSRSVTIHGVVYRIGKADPLGGARLFVCRTNASTRTEADGRYVIQTPATSETHVDLLVSCSGYQPQSIRTLIDSGKKRLLEDWFQNAPVFLEPIPDFSLTNPSAFFLNAWASTYIFWNTSGTNRRLTAIASLLLSSILFLGFYVDRGYPLPYEYGDRIREVIQRTEILPSSHASVHYSTAREKYFSGATYTIGPGVIEVPEKGIEIEARATVRIEPGTELRFRPKSGMIVRGTLFADGSKEKPIRFAQSTPGARWANISILDSSANQSALRHCEVFGAGGMPCSSDKERGRFVPATQSQFTYGGAILVVDSAIRVEDCRVSDCRASRGGAILVSTSNKGEPSSIILTRVTIQNCVALGTSYSSGGGLWAKRASVYCEGCEFVDNHALGSYACGGAMFFWDCGDVKIASGRFARNKSESEGGGIYTINSTGLLWLHPDGNSRIEFDNNEGGGRGGALSAYNSQIRVEGVEFSGNIVRSARNSSDEFVKNDRLAWGGAVYLRYGLDFKTNMDQRVSGCRFRDNAVKSEAGENDWHFGGGGICVMVTTQDQSQIPVNIAAEWKGNSAPIGEDILLINASKMSRIEKYIDNVKNQDHSERTAIRELSD